MAKKTKITAPPPAPKTPEQLALEAQLDEARKLAERLEANPLRAMLGAVLLNSAAELDKKCREWAARFDRDPADALEWSTDVYKNAAEAWARKAVVGMLGLMPPEQPTLLPEPKDDEYTTKYNARKNAERMEQYKKEQEWYNTNLRIRKEDAEARIQKEVNRLASEVSHSSSPGHNLMHQCKAAALANLMSDWHGISTYCNRAALAEAYHCQGFPERSEIVIKATA